MLNFIYSLMTDEKKGVIYAPFKFFLYALSLLYRIGIIARAVLYKFGIFKSEKVPMRMVSVGNLTLGGTGKTPFVIGLVKLIKENLNKDAAVLIRGYGWDEQNMLKASLPDIPVLVGENRVLSARKAIRLYGSSIAVLDDGFQYWELVRDLNIVLVDSRDPFGNGHLFPRGLLREPKKALERADIVVFTKINKAKCDIAALTGDIKKIKGDVVFLEAMHESIYFYNAKLRKQLDLPCVKSRRVVLLSSIGDPEYFKETIEDLGATVVEHMTYQDHYNYRPGDMEKIMNRLSERSFDYIVTTEKDAVKLRRMSLTFGSYTLLTLAVEMKITSGKEKLIARLHSLYSRKIS
jgi:tetraacyldisaccharide 4'-kinase